MTELRRCQAVLYVECLKSMHLNGIDLHLGVLFNKITRPKSHRCSQ